MLVSATRSGYFEQLLKYSDLDRAAAPRLGER